MGAGCVRFSDRISFYVSSQNFLLRRILAVLWAKTRTMLTRLLGFVCGPSLVTHEFISLQLTASHSPMGEMTMAAARQRKQQLISNPVSINAYKIILGKTPSLDNKFSNCVRSIATCYLQLGEAVMLMTKTEDKTT